MDAEVHILFSSDYYDICDFRCHCTECTRSKTEYNENLSLCLTRSGNFYYHAFRNTFDSYTGTVLVSKPGYLYSVKHTGQIPDECTIIIFKNIFYQNLADTLQMQSHWFFTNKDLQSLLLKTNPQIEQLHHALLQAARQPEPAKLQMDNMVMDIFEEVLGRFSNYTSPVALHARLKKHHLGTIEKARQYMVENLSKNISLQQLANHCCVSPFHFSRIFKTFTGYPVYQYLQLLRLKHAQMLLATGLPVADIAYQSGFSSLDYFSSAFKKHFKFAPSVYRNAGEKTARFLK